MASTAMAFNGPRLPPALGLAAPTSAPSDGNSRLIHVLIAANGATPRIQHFWLLWSVSDATGKTYKDNTFPTDQKTASRTAIQFSHVEMPFTPIQAMMVWKVRPPMQTPQSTLV